MTVARAQHPRLQWHECTPSMPFDRVHGGGRARGRARIPKPYSAGIYNRTYNVHIASASERLAGVVGSYVANILFLPPVICDRRCTCHRRTWSSPSRPSSRPFAYTEPCRVPSTKAAPRQTKQTNAIKQGGLTSYGVCDAAEEQYARAVVGPRRWQHHRQASVDENVVAVEAEMDRSVR